MASNVHSTLVDACVWIAYLDKSDSLHSKANKVISKKITSGSLVLTDFIIQEVLTIFLYKNNSAYVEEFLHLLQSDDRLEILSIDTTFLNELVGFIQNQNYQPKISLTDWSILFLGSEFDLEILTFDKQLDRTYKGSQPVHN